MPDSAPRAATIDLDWRVVAFTATVSIFAGLLFGAFPAFMSAPVGESARLKNVSRSTTSGLGQVRVRGLLVVSEVALSLVLLVGAGLLVRSLIALRSVNPGFDVRQSLTARVALPDAAYRDAASVRSFFKRTVDNLEALPGASAAGAASVPLLNLRNQLAVTVRDPAILPGSPLTPRCWATTFKPLASACFAAGHSIHATALDRNRCC